MRKLLILVCLAVALPLAPIGCQHQVTLEAGGAYSNPVLATTDQAILDASHTLSGFLSWQATNASYLSQWPEVGQFAAQVAAQKDGWIRAAYAARDAYAEAVKAYKDGAEVDATRAKVNAAISLLNDITKQITAYKNAHSHV